MHELLSQFERAKADLTQMAETAGQTPELIEQLLEGLQAKKARVKFGCGKVLCLIGQQHPELLYPRFSRFVELLDEPNKILQWQAILILSHLAQVDTEDRFAAIFDRYFAPIRGPVMITAGTIMAGAARMARARPEWADRIAGQLLHVSRARYATPECRNVAIGHALKSLAEFFPLLRDPTPVLRFVGRHRRNPRPAVRQKAESFRKKYAAH